MERMTMRIKYRCKECGNIETYTRKEELVKSSLGIIGSLLIFMGIIMTGIMIVMGPIVIVETMTNAYLYKTADLNSEELRRIAINATEPCVATLSTSSICNGFHIYKHLDDTRYVPANLYQLINTPEDTYHYGSDCKNMAVLYSAMMKSMGFKATIECDAARGHCINIVPYYSDYQRVEGYAVVDLTIPGFYMMESFTDPWDYLLEGQVIG